MNPLTIIQNLEARILMKKILSSATLLILSVFCFACATTSHTSSTSTHKNTKSTTVRTYEHPVAEQTEIDSPATPLVTEGIEKLKALSLNEAEWTFEEAINLDPDYGPAYYWLARVRYKLKDVQQALNLLDKAKALVQGSAVWLQRIEDFRNHLSGDAQ